MCPFSAVAGLRFDRHDDIGRQVFSPAQRLAMDEHRGTVGERERLQDRDAGSRVASWARVGSGSPSVCATSIFVKNQDGSRNR
jgi:hypothetical protein